MPKMKTHRGAAKRFKYTKNGKVKRFKAYKSHLLSSKTRKRKRNLRKGTMVHPTDMGRIKILLPYAK